MEGPVFRPVGYLTSTKEGMRGERGSFYDYVTAENGIFIEAEGRFLAARVQVATGVIRGLAPLEPALVLRYGPIPQHLFDLALSAMLVDPEQERYVAVTWADGYHISVPEQEVSATSTVYEVPDDTVLDLHSHGRMRAFFSGTDNHDETGFRLFGVVGCLSDEPQLRLRVGVYGYHHLVPWDEVFAGSLEGVDDLLTAEPVRLSEDTGSFAYHLARVRHILWRFRR